MTSGTELCRLAWRFVVIAMLATSCTSTIGEGGVLSSEPADSSDRSTADSAGGDDGASGDDGAGGDGDLPRIDPPSGPSLAIKVDQVNDGDSLWASSDEGDLEIRLLGLNAPEGDECFGDVARSRLEQLLDARDVAVSPWPAETDDFGRTLSFLIADGVFVNHALIVGGHAVARDQSGHGYDEEFEEAEGFASDNRLGLWAADACGDDSGFRFEFVEILADAPGNDQENPNGEWVIFENVGDADARLDGWSLRDESTRHRYSFPDVVVPAGVQVQVRTGCGSDDVNGDPIELFWCDPEPPVWNNGGDTAFLLDSNGSIADYMESSRSR